MEPHSEKELDPDVVAEAMYAQDHLAQSLGITISVPEHGQAYGEMKIRKDMLNSHGICHGGVIFSFADTVFAYACNSRNRATVAMSCNISFLKPCKEGDMLSAEALERVKSGRNGIYDVTITGGDGEIVAVFQGNSREIRGSSIPA